MECLNKSVRKYRKSSILKFLWGTCTNTSIISDVKHAVTIGINWVNNCMWNLYVNCTHVSYMLMKFNYLKVSIFNLMTLSILAYHVYTMVMTILPVMPKHNRFLNKNILFLLRKQRLPYILLSYVNAWSFRKLKLCITVKLMHSRIHVYSRENRREKSSLLSDVTKEIKIYSW